MKTKNLNVRLKLGINDEMVKATIDFVRFPLIVFVVLFHSYFMLPYYRCNITSNELPYFSKFSYFLYEELRFPVPLFFFISGFLFFYNIKVYNKEIYKKKIKSRVKTLLIPYLVWNLAAIAVTFLVQSFIPDSMRGTAKSIVDFRISDWIASFLGGAFPYNQPLWFIRNLIVISLLTPLVYFWIKYCKLIGICVLSLLWYFDFWSSINFLDIGTIFWFTLGAYFGYFKINFVDISKTFLRVPFLSLFMLFFVLLFVDKSIWRSYFANINIFLECSCMVGFSAILIERGWHICNLLKRSAFFIYCYHYIIMGKVLGILFLLIKPKDDLEMFEVFLLRPIFAIALGILLYAFLKKFFPKLTAIIVGSR